MEVVSANRPGGLVSVVIPCYNHGKYIRETVESVLNQTYRNFEVIIVNDGSDDPETIEILRSMELPGVSVYHKENGHLASARNYGIERGRGDYILTLDSDDLFETVFLEKAVPILNKHPEVGVVTCYFQYFGSDRKRIFKPQGGTVRDFLVGNNSCGNALFRYQCWLDAGGYNTAMRGFEDWDFWIAVTKNGWVVESIPEILFHYRDTPGSMLKAIEQTRADLYRQIVENHAEVYRQHFGDVLREKEFQILELKSRIRAFKEARNRTLSSKARRSVRRPLRWISRALNERKAALSGSAFDWRH